MRPKASIVTGLAFGDEGKGITTDYLCSYAPEHTLVIRYCGGQQAGHTVMLGKLKHVHSNFGSGTLRGVPSYFSEHCSIYPHTALREWFILKQIGITPVAYAHPFAKLTTIYDVKANQQQERINNHGSCGLGIGTTMKRDAAGLKLHVIDTYNIAVLRAKLEQVAQYYGSKVEVDEEELEGFIENCRDLPHDMATLEELMERYKPEHLVFEGAQGIMLDMDHGIFPHVTYANTTSKNALDICRKLGIPPDVYYVTRCYGTRHGAGWMPEAIDDPFLINNKEEINVYNQWQGTFRYYELDFDLLNHALNIDAQYVTDYSSRNIVVTCLDQRPDFDLKQFNKLHGPFSARLGSYSPYSKDFKSLFHELK